MALRGGNDQLIGGIVVEIFQLRRGDGYFRRDGQDLNGIGQRVANPIQNGAIEIQFSFIHFPGDFPKADGAKAIDSAQRAQQSPRTDGKCGVQIGFGTGIAQRVVIDGQ